MKPPTQSEPSFVQIDGRISLPLSWWNHECRHIKWTPESVCTGWETWLTANANEASENGRIIFPNSKRPKSPARRKLEQSLRSCAISEKIFRTLSRFIVDSSPFSVDWEIIFWRKRSNSASASSFVRVIASVCLCERGLRESLCLSKIWKQRTKFSGCAFFFLKAINWR